MESDHTKAHMAHTFHVLIVALLSMKLKLRAPILQLMAKLKSLEHRGMPSFATLNG